MKIVCADLVTLAFGFLVVFYESLATTETSSDFIKAKNEG